MHLGAVAGQLFLVFLDLGLIAVDLATAAIELRDHRRQTLLQFGHPSEVRRPGRFQLCEPSLVGLLSRLQLGVGAG